MNKPVPLIVSTLQATNLAENAGIKSPVLARCYTNMSIVSGILPRHDWARAYRDRAHRIGHDANDLPALSYTLAGCAMDELGTASWKDATADYQEALEIDARIGDMRHYDEVKNLLSIVLFHQGDFQYGLETAAGVLQRATQRKDIMPQIWSHILRAEMLLRKSEPGTLTDVVGAYEMSVKMLEQNIDLANDIRVSGALALAYLRTGNTERARELAVATVKKAAGNPTAPYAIEGYAGAADALLHLWAQGDSTVRANAENALKALKKFAGVFPLGQPRYQLFEGWFHWLDGKPEKAQAAWGAALAQAQELNMPYEQGRAHLYLGQFILRGEEKVTALHCASDLFTHMGMQYEADQVRALLV